jgi:hypothetical protein
MRRDFLRQIERRIAPPSMKCFVFIQDGRAPKEGISCHCADAPIPYEDCPGYNGQDCPHSTGFTKINLRRVRAGPNGEVQEYGSLEWPFEDDDEVSSCVETD